MKKHFRFIVSGRGGDGFLMRQRRRKSDSIKIVAPYLALTDALNVSGFRRFIKFDQRLNMIINNNGYEPMKRHDNRVIS